MPEKKKLKLDDLKVQSFVTSLDEAKKQTVMGGTEIGQYCGTGGNYCPSGTGCGSNIACAEPTTPEVCWSQVAGCNDPEWWTNASCFMPYCNNTGSECPSYAGCPPATAVTCGTNCGCGTGETCGGGAC